MICENIRISTDCIFHFYHHLNIYAEFTIDKDFPWEMKYLQRKSKLFKQQYTRCLNFDAVYSSNNLESAQYVLLCDILCLGKWLKSEFWPRGTEC